MRILFIDTETNGLPKNRYAPYTMIEAWPAIVQLAWQVWDFTELPAVQLYQSSFLIQPAKGQVWSVEAEGVHRISEAMATSDGVMLAAAMQSLINDANECDLIVAHNIGFDKPTLLAATLRSSLNPNWWPKHELCTMLATKNVCKIPSTSKYASTADPYKWPKLAEVWQTLFPTSPLPENMHNAAQDVTVLVLCFQELVSRNLLVLPAFPTKPNRFADFFRSVLAVLAL